MPPRFRDATFETFDLKRNPKMRPAFEAAQAMARGEGDLLFLYGPPGLGKTHLACAVVQEHPLATFREVPEFLAWLRSHYGKDMGRELVEQSVHNYQQAAVALLVLDDVGAHYQTAWASPQHYRLRNGR